MMTVEACIHVGLSDDLAAFYRTATTAGGVNSHHNTVGSDCNAVLTHACWQIQLGQAGVYDLAESVIKLLITDSDQVHNAFFCEDNAVLYTYD